MSQPGRRRRQPPRHHMPLPWHTAALALAVALAAAAGVLTALAVT